MSKLAVGDGLSLLGVLTVSQEERNSQTSATVLSGCPGASDVMALKTFISGSYIPFAGRTAAVLLTQAELAFHFAEQKLQPVVFPSFISTALQSPVLEAAENKEDAGKHREEFLP